MPGVSGNPSIRELGFFRICRINSKSLTGPCVRQGRAEKQKLDLNGKGFRYDASMFRTARTGTALAFAMLMPNVAFAQNSVPSPPADDTTQITAPGAPNVFLMPTEPAAILAVGSKVNGLNGHEVSPWHIKATYQVFDTKGKLSNTGSYEEFWLSDKSYKRTYTSPTFTQTEYATEQGLYRSGSQDWPGRQETEVRMYLTAPISAMSGLHDVQLKKENLSVGTARLQCVTLKSSQVYPVESAYCFEQDRPMLRLALSPDGSSQRLYNGVVEFQKRFIAKDVRVTYRNNPVLIIHVDEIGGLPASSPPEFTPSPDAKGPLTGKIVVPEETMSTFVLVQVLPIYPVSAKQSHIEGTVTLRITVGKDGVVSGADAISGPDELRKSAVDSVRRWVYQPFVVLGDSTEVETNVRIIFQMGD
jgi:TonB family protein